MIHRRKLTNRTNEGGSVASVSTTLTGKDLRRVNRSESTRVRGVVHSTEIKPYVKCLQHRLNHWIPKDNQIHYYSKFMFDPCDFFCDPSEIIPRVFDRDFDGSVDVR